MFSGTVRTRDRLVFGQGPGDVSEGKVTGVRIFADGADAEAASAGPGQIAKLRGLGDIRIGDAVGDIRAAATAHHFAPPTLESVVVAAPPASRGELHSRSRSSPSRIH